MQISSGNFVLAQDVEHLFCQRGVQRCVSDIDNMCVEKNFCNTISFLEREHVCFLKYNDRGSRQRGNASDIDIAKVVSGTIGDNTHRKLDYLVSGVEGNITALPPHYSISLVLSAQNGKGIHGAMRKWGDAMQQMYAESTQQREEFMQRDVVVNYLGYWCGCLHFTSLRLDLAVCCAQDR